MYASFVTVATFSLLCLGLFQLFFGIMFCLPIPARLQVSLFHLVSLCNNSDLL